MDMNSYIYYLFYKRFKPEKCEYLACGFVIFTLALSFKRAEHMTSAPVPAFPPLLRRDSPNDGMWDQACSGLLG
jgi:hypothetical protein